MYKCHPHVAPAVGRALIPQEPLRITEKFPIRLNKYAVAISYYDFTSRQYTAGNIEWNPCIKNFSV